MTMAELKAELMNISDHFMILAKDQRDTDWSISYQAFHVSEICRKAAEGLQGDPVEAELEGGGSSWFEVCGECHTTIGSFDKFCRECGRPVRRWKHELG